MSKKGICVLSSACNEDDEQYSEGARSASCVPSEKEKRLRFTTVLEPDARYFLILSLALTSWTGNTEVRLLLQRCN